MNARVDTKQQHAALKQKLAAHRSGKVAPPAPRPEEPTVDLEAGPPPQAPRPEKKARPKEPKPCVTYRCGHTEGVAGFGYRDCPGCRNKARCEANQKKREDQAARPPDTSGRLPDGAFMALKYNADRMVWTGTLQVEIGGEPVVFRSEGSGVEWVQRQLGKECLEAVAKVMAESKTEAK